MMKGKGKSSLLIVLTVLLIVSIIGLCACAKEKNDSEKKLSVSPASVTIEVEATQQLTVNLGDEKAEDAGFESSDVSVATVTSNGLVTGVAKGNCLITVTAGGQSVSVSVTVNEKSVVAEDALNITVPSDASVYIGNTLTMRPSARYGSETVTATYTFESENENIATVSSEGVITGVAEGTTKIVVTGTYQNKTDQAECNVNVIKLKKTLTFEEEEVLGVIGKTVMPSLLLNGEPASNADFNFESEDADIASVNSETGEITFVSMGTTTIRAYDEDCSATLEVSSFEGIGNKSEFKSKIAADLDGMFMLTSDIDFEKNTAPLFSKEEKFIGRLEGQGYALCNIGYNIFNVIGGAKLNNFAVVDTSLSWSKQQEVRHVAAITEALDPDSVVSNVYAEVTLLTDGAGTDDSLASLFGIMRGATLENAVIVVKTDVQNPAHMGAVAGNNWDTSAKGIIRNTAVISDVELPFDARGWATVTEKSEVFVGEEAYLRATSTGDFDASVFTDEYFTQDGVPTLYHAPKLFVDTNMTVLYQETATIQPVVKQNYKVVDDVQYSYNVLEGNDYVTVNAGVIFGVAEGTAKIKVSCNVADVSLEQTINVLVKLDRELEIASTLNLGLYYRGDNTEQDKVGTISVIKTTINGNPVEDAQIVWSVENPEIATVDPATGTVTAVAEGTTTVTATWETEQKICEVRVYYGFIRTLEDLYYTVSDNNSKDYILMNDIDFYNAKLNYVRNPYYGTFNGNGFAFRNVAYPVFKQINSDPIADNGVVENLQVYATLGTDIPAGSGALCEGAMLGQVRNVYAEVKFVGDMADSGRRGALFGYVQGSDAVAWANIENVVVKVTLEDVTAVDTVAGLLINQAGTDYGYARAKIQNVIVFSADGLDYQLEGLRAGVSRTGVYANEDAFKSAAEAEKADLLTFDTEIWDISSGIPVFRA